MKHPEDYEMHVHLEIVQTVDGKEFRISSELSSGDYLKIKHLFDYCDTNVIEFSNIRMWILGSTKFIGPPERDPELKYKSK